MIKLLLRLRLSTRLQLAFGLVVLVATLANGFALVQMSLLRGNLDTIVNDNNAKVALSQKLAESVHITSRVVRTVALLTDEKLRSEQALRINAAREAYAEARKSLDGFAADPTTQERLAAIDAAAAKALPLNDKVIELARLNQDADAVALLLQTAAPATQMWQSATTLRTTSKAMATPSSRLTAVAPIISARACW
jgi:phosphoglycerate-specific signal transduction histidine kinase